jgi:hypothetical protein
MAHPVGLPHRSQTQADVESQIWIDDLSPYFDEFGNQLNDTLSEEVESQHQSHVEIPRITGRPRVQYGTGIEAIMTAQFRYLDVRNSPVLRYLQLTHHPTKTFLMRLIKALIDEVEFSQYNELSKPTRIERRSRSALVLWLECHIQHMFQFFESHPHFK